MPALRNKRMELFCLNLFRGKTQYEAGKLAGYGPKGISPTTSRLLTSAKIRARIAELQAAADSAAIMSVQERKARLTEIARAKLTDYMELGQDGAWVSIGKETPNGGAIQEIHSRTEYDDDGSKPTVHTSVKLHDPIRAMAELNKMERLYGADPVTNITNNDNRQIVVNVVSPEAKSLTGRIIEGERTERPTAETECPPSGK